MAVKNPFLYTEVNTGNIPKSTFDLGHEVKFTANAGFLYPCMCEEVLPGDTFNHSVDMFSRLEPLATPMMQSVNMYTHSFYVPNRIVWDNWNDFIRRGDDGETEFAHPWFSYRGLQMWMSSYSNTLMLDEKRLFAGNLFGESSLLAMLGFPPILDTPDHSVYDSLFDVVSVKLSDKKLDSLPIRAYIYIWNEYYRDENLQDKINLLTTDSSSVTPEYGDSRYIIESLYVKLDGETFSPGYLMFNPALPRAWKKDYFTSALPFVQKGDPVTLTVLNGDITMPVHLTGGTGVEFRSNAPNNLYGNLEVDIANGSGQLIANTPTVQHIDVALKTDTLYTKLLQGSLQSVTVEDFRKALRLQWFKEKNAQFGNRIKEFVYSHFGTKISDARLQEPEYLSGYKTPVNISEVTQTSGTPFDTSGQMYTPQGTLTGRGVAASASNSYNRYFEEHGYVITLFSILPEASYSQGLPRKFTRMDSYDYAFPEFAPLGDQELKNYEIYFSHYMADAEENEATFGYQGRYSEYKFAPSRNVGQFLTTYKNWHMGRTFANRPQLNGQFINSSADASNFAPFAVQDPFVDHYLINIYHDLTVTRSLPLYCTPTLL